MSNRLETKYNKSRRATYNLTVHLLFVTKYRYKAQTKAMLEDIKKEFKSVLKAWESELLEFDGEADHAHCLISYPPHKLLSAMVGNMKASATKRIYKNHLEEIRKSYWGDKRDKRVLWTPSYFVASCGGVTIDTLKMYIRSSRHT